MKPTRGHTAEISLSITPLIDVTFLLLIFFMCSMRFKTLERKVEAWLPKTHGINRWQVDTPPPIKIDVLLARAPGERETRIRLLDTSLGRGDAAFAELDRRLAEIHGRAPDLDGQIDAGAEVPHGHVVRCIDSFAKAGVEGVTFVGAKMPRGLASR